MIMPTTVAKPQICAWIVGAIARQAPLHMRTTVVAVCNGAADDKRQSPPWCLIIITLVIMAAVAVTCTAAIAITPRIPIHAAIHDLMVGKLN